MSSLINKGLSNTGILQMGNMMGDTNNGFDQESWG